MRQIFENKINKRILTTGGLEASILESGNICEINKGIIRINQLTGNNLEPTASNIYLRVVENDVVSFTRLIGVGSESKYLIKENKVFYVGEYKGVKYEVCFVVVNDTFFYNVKLDVPASVKAQVFYGMDVAIKDLYAVRNNEAYVCQYINHSVSQDENGYTIMSRQNSGKPHFLEQGSLTKNIGYTTDGYQFFGKDYKLTNEPKAVVDGVMPNEVYQYEFAYAGLQSEELCGTSETLVFYGSFLEEHYEVESTPILREEVKKLYETIDFTYEGEFVAPAKHRVSFTNTSKYASLTEEELNELFPNQSQKEYIDGKLVSFFSDNYAYVTVGEKEVSLERPTGHILLSTDSKTYEEAFAATTWAFGVFASQVVCGNTSFNKFSSHSKNALNVQKITGQRIFVKVNDEYVLLTTPAVYEAGLNYAKWYYKVDGDLIVVTSIVPHDRTEIVTTVKSNNSHEYLVSEFICMAPNDYENPYYYEVEGGKITYIPHEHSLAGNHYPTLRFTRTLDAEYKLHTDEVFYEDGVSRGDSLHVLEVSGNEFSMTLVGDTFGKGYEASPVDFPLAVSQYVGFINGLLSNLHMSVENEESDNIDSLNVILRWYTHNMLVHLTSPHGLEQYSGAAWGTRDVCQGPAEYFLATNNFSRLKDIILHVFSQQYLDNGNWPQWFMIDKYYRIQQNESHGDIIVWPLRLVALYIEKTKDFSILDEMVVYTDRQSCDFMQEKYTLKHHLDNEVKNIILNYIPNTSLSSYGGGDWDDTLQPANHSLASNMVSGWTVALTYEVFTKLASLFTEYDMEEANKYAKLAADIKADYEKYLIPDGIPAGFAYFGEEGIKYIIHPNDQETGMKYRMLPLNRGVVAELFDEEMKDKALGLIKEHLLHADGVRLMDKGVNYRGGINTYFMRAETAANFGREIGLQYCHAHIRYCEALAKVGHADELYKALLQINPVRLHENVKNALPRQRNAYYSSSDGDFLNRYDANANFHKLKDGSVGVKGGWRVYSSGPGIYLNQIISHFLGIRVSGDKLIIDPVVSKSLTGLVASMDVLGHEVTINYVENQDERILVDGLEVAYEEVSNKYRSTGLKIDLNSLGRTANITFKI